MSLLKKLNLSLFLLFFPLIIFQVSAHEREVFFREDFNDLRNWKPLYFPKIKNHTQYTIVKNNERSSLKAESSASASAIIHKKEFNVYTYPRVRWQWKISNIYRKGNAREKSGDDYPARVYIIFKYDPKKAPIVKKIKYALAKKLYGEYPPDSSLNYIWANRRHTDRVITNPYAEEARMILLRAGGENAGTWQEEEVDIIRDYRESFMTNPPSTASIAIMNDSDNTGESSVSYIDYLEVLK